MIDVQAVKTRQQEIQDEIRDLIALDAARKLAEEETTALPEKEPETDPVLDDLLKQIYLAYKSANSALESKDLETAQTNAVELATALTEFEQTYPGTLLGADMRERLNQLHKNVLNAGKSVIPVAVSDEHVVVKFADINTGEKSDKMVSFLADVFKHALDLEYTGAEDKNEDGLVLTKCEKGEKCNLPELASVLDAIVTYVNTNASQPFLESFTYSRGALVGLQLRRETLPSMLPSNRADLPAFVKSLEVLAPIDEKLQKSGYLHGESALNKFLETYEDVWVSVKEKQCMSKLREVLLTHKNSLTLELRRQLVSEHNDATVSIPDPEPELVEDVDEVEEKVDDEWDWDDDEEEEEEKDEQKDEQKEVPATKPIKQSEKTTPQPGNTEKSNPAIERGQLVQIYEECASLRPESTLLYTNLYRSLSLLLYSRATDRLLLYTDALYLSRHVHSAELAEFAESNLNLYIRECTETIMHELLPAALGKPGTEDAKLSSYLHDLSAVSFEEGKHALRERVLGPVLEAMAVYITRQVVKKTDISANESDELARFIRSLNVYAAPLADINVLVPSWNKLQMLSQVLSSNLVNIGLMHEQLMLVDFSTDELSRLVQALFVESDRREALLSAIHK